MTEKVARIFRTSKKERFSYGSYFLGQNIIYMIVLQFLMLFYTDVVGIGAATVGILFGVARTWDAINDPMLGMLVDKSNPKKGKFKPWINAVIPLMPLVTVFLFINPNMGAQGNLIYAYVTYIIWGMVYTISDVPIFALATVMTDQVDERTSLITYGRVAALIAAVIGLALFMPIVQATSWTTAAIVMMTIAFLFMVPIRFFAVERITHDRGDGITFKEIVHFIKSNKPLLVFYAAFLILGMFNTVVVAGAYFATYLLNDANLIGILGLAGMLPLLFIVPSLPVFIRKFGKKKIFITGILVGIVSSMLLYIVGYDNLALVLVLNAIRTASVNMPLLMLGMFSADFVEYGHWKSGKRAEGISFSVQTFATKFASAIGAVIGGVFLEKVYGFVANAEQSAKATAGIFALYTWIPVVGMVIGLIIFWVFYDLKESKVQEIIEEMGVELDEAHR